MTDIESPHHENDPFLLFDDNKQQAAELSLSSDLVKVRDLARLLEDTGLYPAAADGQTHIIQFIVGLNATNAVALKGDRYHRRARLNTLRAFDSMAEDHNDPDMHGEVKRLLRQEGIRGHLTAIALDVFTQFPRDERLP